MSTAAVKTSFFKERVFPILFMFIVTVVFITIVSSVYLATQGTVKLNETLFLKRAILFAANIPVPEGGSQIEKVYQSRIQEVKDAKGNPKYYKVLAENGSAVSGYVVYGSGPGLWGTIQAVIGFNKGLDQMTGIDFIKQSETPGLGARISETWFRSQFRGKSGPFTMVREGEKSDNHQFDAITGATITSTAVRDIVNATEKQVGSIISN